MSLCKHKIGKLSPLPGENEPTYLVPLEWRKPISIFGIPLYLLRGHFQSHANVAQSEVPGILWKEQKDGWSVTLRKGVVLTGLDSIDRFIDLKNVYYSDIG